MLQKCYICKQEKELNSDNFYRDSYNTTGFSKRCKACERTRNRSLGYLSKHPLSRSKYKKDMEYLLSADFYKDLAKKQNNKCAICGKEEPGKLKSGESRRLAIDHNHKTGIIRELLCSACNLRLGAIENDYTTGTIYKFLDYLKKHKA